jgi:hypothetical protein
VRIFARVPSADYNEEEGMSETIEAATDEAAVVAEDVAVPPRQIADPGTPSWAETVEARLTALEAVATKGRKS